MCGNYRTLNETETFRIRRKPIHAKTPNRGVIVSYETIRSWVEKFGHQYAKVIRRDRPAPSGKWHLDKVVITIRGKKYWLWRAVDSKGDVLDILVQSRRNTKAADRFNFRWEPMALKGPGLFGFCHKVSYD